MARKRKLHTLDAGQWPAQIVLTDDAAAYAEFVADFKLKDPSEFPSGKGNGVDARVQAWGRKAPLIVITVDPKLKGMPLASTLAHEAVHVSDIIFEHIEEDEPGMETRAYLVEWVMVQSLKALGKW